MKTLLVIAYVSMWGQPRIETHNYPDGYAKCLSAAKQHYERIKVGSARVWCVRVPESEK